MKVFICEDRVVIQKSKKMLLSTTTLTKEVILAPLTSALADLLEESAQSTHTSHLVQPRHRVHHWALVVVVPDVQVKNVRRYVVDITTQILRK